MWARKRIDIDWCDLAYGILQCLVPGSAARAQALVEQQWLATGQSLACLSVRTGWDLFLTAVAWPAGSEVLMSAVTIPDMVRVLEAHGLVAVPLDVDPATAFPTPESIRERTTPRTKAVLLAPLFGARVPLDEHLAAARDLNLCCLLDGAQAYRGADFRGDERCDTSMFSFGPIKTATALGGALLSVPDAALCSHMRDLQSRFPAQSRLAFARRILKYALIRLLSTRAGLRSLMGLARLLGRDPDVWLDSATRGFPATRLLPALRRRPAYPLLKLLARRLGQDDESRRSSRTRMARRLALQLSDACVCPAAQAADHVFWVFPILVDDPPTVRRKLRTAGFDSSLAHSLRVVPAPPGDRRTAPVAADMLRRLVFLPLDERMNSAEQDRLAEVVKIAADGTPPGGRPTV